MQLWLCLFFSKRAALNVEAIKKNQNEDTLQQEAFERVNKKSPLYSSIPNTFDAVKEKGSVMAWVKRERN